MKSIMMHVPRFPRALWILYLGIFLNRFGSFVSVFLVLYMVARGYSVAQAGLVVGSYGLGSMGASLVGGYLADRQGRRSTIVVSMFFSAASMLLLSQVSTLPLIIFMASLTGLTTGLYRPAASALLVDLVPSEQRVKAFAWYRLTLNLGFAAGPALAGLLASRTFFFLFLADAGSSIVFGLLALLWLPEGVCRQTGHRHTEKSERRDASMPSPRWDARFLIFLGASTVVAFVYFQMNSTLPLQITLLGLPKVVFGFLLSLNGIVIILLELPLSHLTQRFPPVWMIAAGWVLTGLGFGLLAVASGTFLLALSVVCWTVGEILHHPASATYVADLAPMHQRGRYQGYWEFTWSIAQTIGPVVGALAFSWDASRFWILCGGAACLAALPLFIKAKKRALPTPAIASDERKEAMVQCLREVTQTKQRLAAFHEQMTTSLTELEAQIQSLQEQVRFLNAQCIHPPSRTPKPSSPERRQQVAHTMVSQNVLSSPVALSATRDGTEQVVRRIFAQVLGKPVEQIRRDEDFFTSGGDSDTLRMLLYQIEHAFHFHLDANDIFEHATAPQLATFLACICERTPSSSIQKEAVSV